MNIKAREGLYKVRIAKLLVILHNHHRAVSPLFRKGDVLRYAYETLEMLDHMYIPRESSYFQMILDALDEEFE